MTSSTRARIDGGIVSPSAFAVLRFIVRPNFARRLNRDSAGIGTPEDLIDKTRRAVEQISVVGAERFE